MEEQKVEEGEGKQLPCSSVGRESVKVVKGRRSRVGGGVRTRHS